MSTESDDPTGPVGAGLDAWLDGLAGRPAALPASEGQVSLPLATVAFAHGQRLRGALLQTPAADAGGAAGQASPSSAGWQALLERARPATAANETLEADTAAPPPGPPSPTAPGNNHAVPSKSSPWRGRAWAAAASVAALALLLNLAPRGADEPGSSTGDTGLRGDAGAADATARWRSAQPASDAAQLAVELRAAGAQVQLEPLGAGVLLRVLAPPDARAATNTLLAPLETALGADGQLQLLVLPVASTGAGFRP